MPVFWGNEQSGLHPKPKIKTFPNMDPNFLKTEVHFEELFTKYGPQIFVLNLVKTIKDVSHPDAKSQEFELGNEFGKALADLTKKFQQKNVG